MGEKEEADGTSGERQTTLNRSVRILSTMSLVAEG